MQRTSLGILRVVPPAPCRGDTKSRATILAKCVVMFRCSGRNVSSGGIARRVVLAEGITQEHKPGIH
eukprot:8654641-Pyramimonas_sp.AAC.1